MVCAAKQRVTREEEIRSEAELYGVTVVDGALKSTVSGAEDTHNTSTEVFGLAAELRSQVSQFKTRETVTAAC